MRVDDGAESLARQELREEHESAKQTIEEAIRATREARERMDWHREEIQKGETQAAAESAQAAAQAMKKAAESASAENPPLEQAGQAEALEKLAGRQEQVAKAMDALAKGNPAEALKGLQAVQAEAASELSHAMEAMPQLEGSGPLQEAKNSGKQGSQQAAADADQGLKNQQSEASKQHEQAGQNFAKSAESLNCAADEFPKWRRK